MQKRPHQQNGGALRAPPFLPAFFCILFFTILGYFRKYFEKKLKKMVGNEGFGYEVAMKGGYERWLLFFTERVTNQELPKLAQNAAKRPHQQNGALRAPFLPAFFAAFCVILG